MNKKDHEGFQNSTQCWISIKAYEEGEVKVQNHDQITVKYQRSIRGNVI